MYDDQWRSLMGEGLMPWAGGPGGLHEVTDSSWTSHSGFPAADVNVTVSWAADERRVSDVFAAAEARALPALVLLAGAAKAHGSAASDRWQPAGEMPMMWIDLSDADTCDDPRARVAGPADRSAVTALLAEAFEISHEEAEVSTLPLEDPSGTMVIWLLEEHGVPVSTVTMSFAGATTSVWCMATPPRLGRRGHGRALLGSALGEARSRGARTGLLGATPEGLPLYESTGWRTIETWDVYTSGAYAPLG